MLSPAGSHDHRDDPTMRRLTAASRHTNVVPEARGSSRPIVWAGASSELQPIGECVQPVDHGGRSLHGAPCRLAMALSLIRTFDRVV